MKVVAGICGSGVANMTDRLGLAMRSLEGLATESKMHCALPHLICSKPHKSSELAKRFPLRTPFHSACGVLPST